MQYLVVFVPKHPSGSTGPPADFAQKEAEEEVQAQILYTEGRLRQVWALDTEHRGGVCLFEAESPAHLQKLIDSFPLVKVNYAEYQILPLAPYTWFAKKS